MSDFQELQHILDTLLFVFFTFYIHVGLKSDAVRFRHAFPLHNIASRSRSDFKDLSSLFFHVCSRFHMIMSGVVVTAFNWISRVMPLRLTWLWDQHPMCVPRPLLYDLIVRFSRVVKDFELGIILLQNRPITVELTIAKSNHWVWAPYPRILGVYAWIRASTNSDFDSVDLPFCERPLCLR